MAYQNTLDHLIGKTFVLTNRHGQATSITYKVTDVKPRQHKSAPGGFVGFASGIMTIGESNPRKYAMGLPELLTGIKDNLLQEKH